MKGYFESTFESEKGEHMLKKQKPKIKNIYTFDDRLTVKLLGRAEYILRHITELRRIYPVERLNFSPILKNRDSNGFHCFVNIIME